MIELKPRKGFVKTINFSMQTLQEMKKHCKTEKQVQILTYHINNMQKLKNCCTFALSDNRFDFVGVMQETQKRIIESEKNGD